jgi:hypothetical protein
MVRESEKTVVVAETRRSGFLGWRNSTVDVRKPVRVQEAVIGPHWVLRQTDHHIESRKGGKLAEYHEQTYWVLLKDGELLKIWKWDDYTRWPDGTTKSENDCTATPMTEADVLRLDFADLHMQQGSRRSGEEISGTRYPGRRVHHSKGVGLSVALKALLRE